MEPEPVKPVINMYRASNSGFYIYELCVPDIYLQTTKKPKLKITWWLLKLIYYQLMARRIR